VESVKRGLESLKLKNLLLEAVARERLVKTQEALKKCFADAMEICELWRLAVEL
jgi:hypothetical protein